MNKPATVTLATLFLGCIVAANYVTTRYGMTDVGFGLTATAGTWFAGLTFAVRDTIQDTAGRHARRLIIRLIVAGAVLSLIAGLIVGAVDTYPGLGIRIAIASGITFLIAEYLDYRIYTPLRATGYARAAVASNIAGTTVDTFLFLWLAGFPIMSSLAGQLVGKLLIALPFVLLVVLVRGERKLVHA